MVNELVGIGVLHGRIRLGAKRANLKELSRVVREILETREPPLDRPEIIALPPYPLTGPVIGYYPEQRLQFHVRSSAERIGKGSSSLAGLVKIAVENRVDLIAGPFIERAGPHLFVTLAYIDKYGGLTAKYRKIGVTSQEYRYSIRPGREPGVFISPSGIRIGVFIDEDLAYPEVFRALQRSNVNIIIGFMLPYLSDYFRLVQDDNHMITMERGPIESFLEVRSRETGLPIILVGGVVESTNSKGTMAYMDTIPVEPDVGIVRDKVKSVDSTTSLLHVTVSVRHSRPRPLDQRAATLYRRYVASK